MGVDDYRDREGDAEERTGLGQGEGGEGAEAGGSGGVSERRDAEGDAEERTGVGSDPAGVDDFSDDASLGDDTVTG